MRNDCFRDPQQRFEVCRALLATGDLAYLWTDKGPTDEASALARDPSRMPEGHRALLLASLAFWTGKAVPLRVDELITLEAAEPICKLLTATIYGHKAIDVWLTRSDDVEGFVASAADAHAAAAELFDEARAVFAEGSQNPINYSSAPDACALGASQMAEYVLMKGVKPVRKDSKRHKVAMELTVHVLGLFAAIERDCAEKADDAEAADDQDEDAGDTDGSTTPTTE
jgi:hypothetical protein